MRHVLNYAFAIWYNTSNRYKSSRQAVHPRFSVDRFACVDMSCCCSLFTLLQCWGGITLLGPPVAKHNMISIAIRALLQCVTAESPQLWCIPHNIALVVAGPVIAQTMATHGLLATLCISVAQSTSVLTPTIGVRVHETLDSVQHSRCLDDFLAYYLYHHASLYDNNY